MKVGGYTVRGNKYPDPDRRPDVSFGKGQDPM